jgi:ABC-type antimicrobial peptide transport system permease subunit
VFTLPARELVTGAILVVLLGIISGLLPALQAMRLSAVEALRRE